MEVFAVIAVIAVLFIVLGISMEYVVYAASLLAVLLIAAMVIFFDISLVVLLCSRKTKGTLLRVEKNEKYRFKRNIYAIDGREVPCRFPTDGLYGRRNAGKICTLRINRKGTAVFDPVSSLTCIVGFVLCNAAVAAAVYIFTNILK